VEDQVVAAEAVHQHRQVAVDQVAAVLAAAEAVHQHRQVAVDQVEDQAAAEAVHQHLQAVEDQAEDNLQARKQQVLGNKDPVKTQGGRAVGGLVEIKHLETPTILVNLVQKAEAVKVVQAMVLTKAARENQINLSKIKVKKTTRGSLTNLSKTKAAKMTKMRVAERKLLAWRVRLQGLTLEVRSAARSENVLESSCTGQPLYPYSLFSEWSELPPSRLTLTAATLEQRCVRASTSSRKPLKRSELLSKDSRQRQSMVVRYRGA
jgi:hypothetical protein